MQANDSHRTWWQEIPVFVRIAIMANAILVIIMYLVIIASIIAAIVHYGNSGGVQM